MWDRSIYFLRKLYGSLTQCLAVSSFKISVYILLSKHSGVSSLECIQLILNKILYWSPEKKLIASCYVRYVSQLAAKCSVFRILSSMILVSNMYDAFGDLVSLV